MARPLDIVRIPGRTPYAEAWALQRAVHAEVAGGRRADTLLLLEHPRTLTMGRRGGWANLVTPPRTLVEMGFELFQIDRGGDITYHGPGQLVGYPIVNLERAGVGLGDFIRGMERAHIALCAHHGITAAQDPGFTGVWIGLRKITAIGVRVSKWTTLHGFAINVATHLDDFEHIVPCGLDGRGVTSLTREVEREIEFEAVANWLAGALARELGAETRRKQPAALPLADPAVIEQIQRDSRLDPEAPAQLEA